MDGSMTVGDRVLTSDDIVIAQRGAILPGFDPGPEGVQFVELIRSAAGAALVVDAAHRDEAAFSHFPETLTEVEFTET
jgi:hypothetical protein